MSGHHITKCSECNKVISQCRCNGPHEIRYDVCDECKTNKPMNKLSANEIDNGLQERDGRKTVRKLVDDAVSPAVGLAAGAAAATVGAIGSLKEVNRMKEVG